MKVVKVTKEYFELEDGSIVQHMEPLIEVPSLEEFQEIYDNMEKFIKGE
jgi:hypothetical protein